jgi:DNA-directed RNA polymerase subunit RPC12/RpoP
MTGQCTRGAWCAWRVTRWEDGQHVTEPAETPRAFCPRDEQLIGEHLAAMPRLYLLLAAELGQLRAASLGSITGTAGARVPLNLPVDALMRDMADVLISWHERVAAVAAGGLSAPEVRCAGWYVTDGPQQVMEACKVLAAHLTALLALQTEWMTRRMTVAAAARLSADVQIRPWLSGIVRPHADYAEIDRPLSGADAGLEVFGLRTAARRILGEVKARPDDLTGVRCKSCDRKVLYRADQADAGRSDTGYYSACGYCGHRMLRGEYDTWVRQWAVYERARLKSAPERLENLPGVA